MIMPASRDAGRRMGRRALGGEYRRAVVVEDTCKRIHHSDADANGDANCECQEACHAIIFRGDSLPA